MMNSVKGRTIFLLPSIILISLYFFQSACKSQAKSEKTLSATEASSEVLQEEAVNSGIKFDTTYIDSFLIKYPSYKKYAKTLRKFYRKHDSQYIWFNDHGLSENAHGLLSQFSELDSSANESQELIQKVHDVFHFESNSTEDVDVAPNPEKELLLTSLFYDYANIIGGGTINETTSKKLGWFIPRKKMKLNHLIDTFLTTMSAQKVEQSAVNPMYYRMQDGLAKYNKIAADSNDIEIPSLSGKQKSLKLNDSSSIIRPLRQRLVQLGLVTNLPDTNKYTGELLAAVNRAKKIYGFKQDSVINNNLIHELNIKASDRVKQIVVNMERIRWMPEKAKANEYILVNIPGFRLNYYKDRKRVWACNVVTGKVMNKTVIFSGEMQYVVFSPYWNVPTSIINKEIKPGMARNPNYLAKHNMEWNGGQVRQKPGASNSLGKVKFLFPNSNNIYLHDTPSKSLFNEETRAFSHGCVRVAEPYELALRVLAQDSSWTPEKIQAAMNAGKERTVVLKKKIPVVIGYFTSFVDDDGDVNFRKDIYNRDQELFNTLAMK